MKKILLILFTISIVLVGCGDKGSDELTTLSKQLSNLDVDTTTAKNTLKNMKYLDEVLIEENLEYPIPKTEILKDSSDNMDNVKLFVEVMDVTLQSSQVSILNIKLKAEKITQEEYQQKIETFKSDYKEKRNVYIKAILEYIVAVNDGDEVI